MSETYDWDETLEMGTMWESELGERLESILTTKTVENISYQDSPETQLAGIDAVLSSDDAEFDVKVQRNEHIETGNLPFETWSVDEKGIPGWLYAGDATVIVWVYENKAGTNFLPTGYFMYKDEQLIDWFNDRIKEFREITVETNRSGESWHTRCRLVPIEEIPESHITEFNPTMKKNRETNQFELTDEWV